MTAPSSWIFEWVYVLVVVGGLIALALALAWKYGRRARESARAPSRVGPGGIEHAAAGLQDKIFISFASADQKVAQGICNDLEKRGFSCWISSRDIFGGERYPVAIARAIAGVKVMVLVFSANANQSEEILNELDLAKQKEPKTVIIPLRIENILPSGGMAYHIRSLQWHDFFENRERELLKLCDRLSSIVTVSRESSPIV